MQESIDRYGAPEIFNTDQGSQFTSFEFTQLLKGNGIAISMDGKGCWRNNEFVERLWKSIKYEAPLNECKFLSNQTEPPLNARSSSNASYCKVL